MILGLRVATLIALLALAGAGRAETGDQEFECVVEPKEMVVVSAAVEGVVHEVLVGRGDRVEKGQLLATLESSMERRMVDSARSRAEASAEMEGARVAYELARRRFERTQELFEKGVVSDVDLDEARGQLDLARHDRDLAKERKEQAELELARAQAVLGLRSIRSSIDGVVVRRLRGPGEYADPPELFEIAQIDPLYIEVIVPATLLGQVQPDMGGRVRFEEPVGGAHEAEVVVVDPIVNAASGTFGVRLELPNPGGALPAGLKCWVRFGENRVVREEPEEAVPQVPIEPVPDATAGQRLPPVAAGPAPAATGTATAP